MRGYLWLAFFTILIGIPGVMVGCKSTGDPRAAFRPELVFGRSIKADQVNEIRVRAGQHSPHDYPEQSIVDQGTIVAVINCLATFDTPWVYEYRFHSPADFVLNFMLTDGSHATLWLGHGFAYIKGPGKQNTWYQFNPQALIALRDQLKLPHTEGKPFAPLELPAAKLSDTREPSTADKCLTWFGKEVVGKTLEELPGNLIEAALDSDCEEDDENEEPFDDYPDEYERRYGNNGFNGGRTPR